MLWSGLVWSDLETGLPVLYITSNDVFMSLFKYIFLLINRC
jgi:hypothetical protein